MNLADRAHAYLDGDLSPEESRRFEEDLLQPEVSRALGEALAIRKLLADVPPAGPPPELVRRIQARLAVAPAPATGKPATEEGTWSWAALGLALQGQNLAWSTGRTVASGAGTGWSGLRYTFAPSGGAGTSLEGFRYTLGPLAVRSGGKPAPAPKPPTWRRALRWAWKRVR